MKAILESLAALTLVVLLIAAIALVIVVPARERLLNAEARIAELQTTIDAFRLRAENTAAGPVQIVSPTVLLPGTSSALAAAEVQDLLAEAAARSGVEVDRVQFDDPVSLEELVRIGVGARISTRLGPLADLLHDLESGTPYLVITDLSITRSRGIGGEVSDAISADLSLSGFMAKAEE